MGWSKISEPRPGAEACTERRDGLLARNKVHEVEALLAHSSFLKSLSRALVSDCDTADDLVQETWVAALRRPPRDMSTARAWLGRVLRNAAISLRRRNSKRRDVERAAARLEAVSPRDLVSERASAGREVVEAVLELKEPYRSTILFRYFEEFCAQDIAALERVSVETVKTRLKRGLALLRAKLVSRYGADHSLWSVGSLAGGTQFLRSQAANTTVVSGHAFTTTKALTIGGFLMTTKAAVTTAIVVTLVGLGLSYVLINAPETKEKEHASTSHSQSLQAHDNTPPITAAKESSESPKAQESPVEQALDEPDEIPRDDVIGRLASMGSEESLLALLDLYCEWNQDKDAVDRGKIVPILAAAEDPFLALDLLCGAASCLPEETFLVLFASSQLFKTAEVRNHAQRLLLDSNEVSVQKFLAISLIHYAGPQSSLTQSDRDLLASDLATLYQTTTDQFLRSSIVTNIARVGSRRTTFQLAEAAFSAGPDSYGHSQAWQGIDALRRLVAGENRQREKGEETANSTQEASRLIVKVALTSDIDLRSFQEAVSALKEIDPDALYQLRGRITHPYHAKRLETAIESLEAKQ